MSTLLIRNEQMNALRRETARQFEARLAEHARDNFPLPCDRLGDELHDAIAEVVARARHFGFDGERELCKYVNLAFTFGRDFDRSVLLPWAAPILGCGLPGPAKMERLYAKALEYEDEGRGFFAPLDDPH